MVKIKEWKLRWPHEYWAITDLNERAQAIYRNQLRGRCEESRAVIRSVEEVGMIGIILQANIEPEETK